MRLAAAELRQPAWEAPAAPGARKDRPIARDGKGAHGSSPKRIAARRGLPRIRIFGGGQLLFGLLTGLVRDIPKARASWGLAEGSIHGKRGHCRDHANTTTTPDHLLTCHWPDTSICTRIRGVSVALSILPAVCGICTTS